MNRTCELPQRGEVDELAGEFWVDNPFEMPELGHNLSAYEKNKLFMNVQGTGFVDVSSFSAVNIDSDSRSAITADFNHDGRTDILVGSVGGGPLRLFLNRMPAGNNFVRIEAEGVRSNRLAVGARCQLTCGDLTLTRDLFPRNPCMGQGPAELVIGVGRAKQIDLLRIRWPSGKETSFQHLPVNQVIRIREDSADPEISSDPGPQARR